VSEAGPLFELQEESYRRADGSLRDSWPKERTMGVAELDEFLAERRYCVLATTTKQGHAQARPVAFTVLGGVFWFATVAGGRLRNLESTPWASVVISEGEGDDHRAVAADGPVAIAEQPAEGVLELWRARFGSRAEWASAWFALRPERLFSYTRA
jgi:nitroimidazol reductase NimA-like FMN-containing flavoprotein (pyridoxamine 5'-phosphate oxidase superfamily)